MKTKRFVSTLLALLLVCSLPVSAFAATVDDNPAGTTVTEIPAGDMMYSNSGTVTNNDGAVNYNHGILTNNNNFVRENYGTVTNNYGEVNENYGTVTTNGTLPESETAAFDANAIVHFNYGTVTTNNGVVNVNGGTVTTNNGTVEDNCRTVETNSVTGTVTNKGNGTVETNYGTVTEADGSTHYGVLVDNDGDVSLTQKEKGETMDLSQLFTKEGYVYAGYTQEYQLLDGVLTKQAITVSDTSYTADCPNVLTLIWQAIVNPDSGSGSGENASAAGETAAADDGAGYFGPGSFVSINGHKFLLVAVVEDVYCLASVDSFGEEQLSDLPALLASLLTEDQLTHVTGEPELLDEELTARFFAGEGSHIVFPCDSSLIFS